MSAIKKVIVLSNKQTGNGPMAVLTLYKNSSGVFGALKNYDIHIKDAILGISLNSKQVLKHHISFDNRNTHTFKLDDNFSLNGKIGCVLVENSDGKITPLVWGLSGGNENYKQVVMDSLQALIYKMNEINEQNKKPEIVLKKINEVSSRKDNAMSKANDEIKHEAESEKDSDCAKEEIKEVDNDLNEVPSGKEYEVGNVDETSGEIPNCENKGNQRNEEIKKEKEFKEFEEPTEFQKRIAEKVPVWDVRQERTKKQESEEEIIHNLSKLKAKYSHAQQQPDERTGFHENFMKVKINDDDTFIAVTLDSSSSMQEMEEKVIKVDKISEEEASLFEYVDEEIEDEIDKSLGFYNLIKEQVDELFAKYPAEKDLENLIPESKWVKVDYENDGHYYVIGLIYEENLLKYICYGVPGTHDKEPPSDLAKYSQWIPLKPNQPESEGYWLMYQDASDGHSVNLEVI